LRRVFRIPFRRPPIERDVDEELAFHIELRVERLVALGMSADDARREALRQFGAMEPVRESCITFDEERVRAMNRNSLFTNLRQDFAYAVRTLDKHKGFAAIVALTMMLGIGANAAVFSVAYGVLLRPLPYKDAGALVRLWSRNDSRNLEFFSVSPADYATWRERNRVFSATGAFERQREATLSRGDEPQAVQTANVMPAVFGVLGTPALLGRPIVDSDAQPGAAQVAVLEHDLWTNRFGSDSSIVGSDIVLDGRKITVVGVMPPRFSVPGNAAEIWTPLSLAGASPDHSNRFLRVLGRLAPGASIETARVEMDRIAAQIGHDFAGSNRDWRVSIMSVPEMVVGRQWRRAVIVLTGVVGFVLLIACANAANLQLARGASRRREIALRAALGAGRGRIVTQLLAESTVLAAVGGIAGLALAYVGVGVLRAVGAATVPRLDEVQIDTVVLAFTVLVTIASGLLFGIIPAVGASRTDIGEVLKEGGRGAGQGVVGQGVRAALVVAQVALSLVLLVGAGLLMKSFVKLQQVDIGFKPDNVHVVPLRLPDARYPDAERYGAFYGALLDRVRQIPGVRGAAVVSSAPFLGPNSGMSFIIPERPPAPGDPAPDADTRAVSSDYFRTMGIGLVRGRVFTDADRQGAPNAVVITEIAARSYWPDVDPIGRQIQRGTGERATLSTIVGIVRDARYQSLNNPEVRPMMYFSAQAWPERGMTVVAQTDNAASFAAGMRQATRQIDPLLPLGTISSMESLVASALATQRFALVLFAIFALTALLLAAIGMYGVLSYLVRQRTHELGIRVALGASSQTLVGSVVGGAMRFAIPGVLIGLVAAWALTRLLASLLFGVSPTDVPTLAGVSVLLTATAALASFVPARRATRADPMLALRGEG
jgi:putative ABC transport system permease protein